MSTIAEIYVCLIGEGVGVWRPVRAVHVGGSTYRIADQAYDKNTETWQFVPGDVVICEMIASSDGQILAATQKA